MVVAFIQLGMSPFQESWVIVKVFNCLMIKQPKAFLVKFVV
ncbi:Uncharacterised protein [Vibrio cincinnatiensis]|uniref:Uncharacterized protein n=1 Tax=Vibrio cincinnatiensis DSM 19608 TaxID=1123491 RepID=A0A1T4LU40_VIBCI|nr:hypothetical protein SAMN02745782_00739 [Vibrio cincinnatiensis DSM 19608]SUP06271.1 Uncharacterised protein [Vibrio cincinnatiensis]